MTLVLPPETGSSYDESAPARAGTGRRRVRVAVVALTLVALAWLALPLTVRVGQEVEPRLPVESGLFVPGYGDDGTFALHYRHHDEVTLTVPIRNNGPVPITIDDARIDDAPLPLLVSAGDNLPIDVGPWDQSDLELTFRFDNCRYYHERSADTWDRVWVEGSVLGRGFDDVVELSYPIALHGQVIGTCPDRTLIRGDDVRPH